MNARTTLLDWREERLLSFVPLSHRHHPEETLGWLGLLSEVQDTRTRREPPANQLEPPLKKKKTAPIRAVGSRAITTRPVPGAFSSLPFYFIFFFSFYVCYLALQFQIPFFFPNRVPCACLSCVKLLAATPFPH